jgi:hypothetical protein
MKTAGSIPVFGDVSLARTGQNKQNQRYADDCRFHDH